MVALNVQNWICSIIICLISSPIFILGALWGNTYLRKMQDIEPRQASLIVSILYIGIIFGAPIMGYISDNFLLHRIILKFGTLVLLILNIFLLFSMSFIKLLILFGFIGFFIGVKSIGHSIIMHTNEDGIIGSAIGFTFLVIILGSAILQTLFNFLLNWHWNVLIEQVYPINSKCNMLVALIMLPLCMLCCFLCTFLLDKPELFQKGKQYMRNESSRSFYV